MFAGVVASRHTEKRSENTYVYVCVCVCMGRWEGVLWIPPDGDFDQDDNKLNKIMKHDLKLTLNCPPHLKTVSVTVMSPLEPSTPIVATLAEELSKTVF